MILLGFLLALTPPDPHHLVDGAIAAMQRTTSMRDVRSIRQSGVQHEYILGNGERFEGPFRVQYLAFSELRAPQIAALRRSDRFVSTSGLSPERVTVLTDSVTASFASGREIAGSHGSFEDMIDRVDGSPDRALLLASASDKLTLAGSARHYGLTYDVVSFPWRNGQMKIEISRSTHLPDAVEIVRQYEDNFRWNIFRTVTMRTEYLDWNVATNGMLWPMQIKTSLNGEPLRDITVSAVKFDVAAPPADSFAIADSTRSAFTRNSALGFSRFAFGARGKPTELAPGIVRVPDQWAMTMAKQSDGVVIFEAHISPNYVGEVIAEANRRWPGAPIKAFVLTSDPWGHLGGLSAVVDRGIPIYAAPASIPSFASLVKGSKKPARFIPVSDKTVIGSGADKIELYPVGGAYAERMLMAYFPRHKLLYGADLVFFNRGPDGKPSAGFIATPAEDLRAAVAREKLDVETLFCVQNYPSTIKWADFAR